MRVCYLKKKIVALHSLSLLNFNFVDGSIFSDRALKINVIISTYSNFVLNL